MPLSTKFHLYVGGQFYWQRKPGKDAACIGEGDRMYEPQSPYREPWPKHYGWENKLFGGGKVIFITTKTKIEVHTSRPRGSAHYATLNTVYKNV
jgi:hypothetical protein